MWVVTQDLPHSAAHPFYTRLNQILDQHDFDGFVEGSASDSTRTRGRPGLPPGRYFRLLLIGYFEGLEPNARSRGAPPIRWPCAVSRVGVAGGAA